MQNMGVYQSTGSKLLTSSLKCAEVGRMLGVEENGIIKISFSANSITVLTHV
jgi:hypothetical protein